MKKIPHILVLVLGIVACQSFFVEEPSNQPEAIFEHVWQTFQEEYAPFGERGVDWSQAYGQFRPMVTANSTDDELFDALSQLLGTLDDGHVTLTAPGRNVFISNTIRRELIDDDLFDLEVVKNNYLEPGFKVGPEGSYIYGKVNGQSVGYIFFEYVGDNFFVMGDFLDQFSDAEGIIIDMRHNDGGDFTFAFSEIGRLTNQRSLAFRSKTKNGIGPGDFTPWFDWYVEPVAPFFTKPVVVLTDRFTISAGERAVMAFITFPNTLTMGDTTNGAHGTMIGRELPNGWFYSLVPQKVELFDGKSYEGIGLAPDIYVKNKLSDILAGKDETLETAIFQLVGL